MLNFDELNIDLSFLDENEDTQNKIYNDSPFTLNIKEQIFKLTNIYCIITPFDKLILYKSCYFTKYLKIKSQSFFQNLVLIFNNFENENGSIWCWKYSKDKILFITTYENNFDINILNERIYNKNLEIKKLTKVNKIESIIYKMHFEIKKYINYQISNFKIFDNYNDACNNLKFQFNSNIKIPTLEDIINDQEKNTYESNFPKI